VPIAFTGNGRASDAAALDTGGETVTSEPGSLTVSAVFTNGIVCGLIVDTDAQDVIGFEVEGSKVGVMGSSKLSGKFTVVPAALARAPAALKVKCWLILSTGFERVGVEIPQQFCYPLQCSRHVPRQCESAVKPKGLWIAHIPHPH